MFKVTYQLITVTTDLNWAAKGTVSLKKAMRVLLCHQGIPKCMPLETHFAIAAETLFWFVVCIVQITHSLCFPGGSLEVRYPQEQKHSNH